MSRSAVQGRTWAPSARALVGQARAGVRRRAATSRPSERWWAIRSRVASATPSVTGWVTWATTASGAAFVHRSTARQRGVGGRRCVQLGGGVVPGAEPVRRRRTSTVGSENDSVDRRDPTGRHRGVDDGGSSCGGLDQRRIGRHDHRDSRTRPPRRPGGRNPREGWGRGVPRHARRPSGARRRRRDRAGRRRPRRRRPSSSGMCSLRPQPCRAGEREHGIGLRGSHGGPEMDDVADVLAEREVADDQMRRGGRRGQPRRRGRRCAATLVVALRMTDGPRCGLGHVGDQSIAAGDTHAGEDVGRSDRSTVLTRQEGALEQPEIAGAIHRQHVVDGQDPDRIHSSGREQLFRPEHDVRCELVDEPGQAPHLLDGAPDRRAGRRAVDVGRR